jgi:SnoaL-like domain
MPVDERERERRRRLVQAHVAAENAHDIEAIMATFAPHAIGQTNGDVSTTSDAIRQAHMFFGLSQETGIFTDLQVVHEVEHFSDEEIIYEGHFVGLHTGTAPAYPPPSGREIQLPYVVAYRFDREGLLVSESARIEFSAIFAGATP